MTVEDINKQIRELENQRNELLQYNPTVCGVGYVGDNYNKKTDKNLYQRWNNILQRCYNPNSVNYQNINIEQKIIDNLKNGFWIMYTI